MNVSTPLRAAVAGVSPAASLTPTMMAISAAGTNQTARGIRNQVFMAGRFGGGCCGGSGISGSARPLRIWWRQLAASSSAHESTSVHLD